MTQQNEANFQGQLQAALVDDPDFLRELVRDVLQKFLEAEFSSFLGAEPHQRT